MESQSSTSTLQQQRQARRKRDGNNTDMGDEEIVGTLDEAVGYSLNVSKSNMDQVGSQSTEQKNSNIADGGSASTSNLERALLGNSTTSQQPYLGPNGYIYDSDSSDDEKDHDNGATNDVIMRNNVGVPRPLTLPFPNHGMKERHSNDTVDTSTATERTRPAAPATTEFQSHFPFLNTEEGSYFLVQLPTRLPPVMQRNDSSTSSNNNINDPSKSDMNHDPDVRIVEPTTVATPSIQTNAFDNALIHAQPGRIGKLKIYRSGRTVLVLDDPSPSRMITSGGEDTTTTTNSQPVRL
jgi:hypothetical protein